MQHFMDRPVEAKDLHPAPEDLDRCDVVTLAIAEMECPSCANRIRNALLAQKGVVEAEMDVSATLGRVWYDPARVSVGEILRVVIAVGEGTQHQFLPVVLAIHPAR